MTAFIEEDAGSKGRAAVAARTLQPGECILLTKPVAVVSLLACGWCLALPGGARNASLSRCGGCRLVRYCSRRCQQSDWRDGHHGQECASWRQVPANSRSPPQTLLLVARLAARLYLQPNGATSDEREQVEQLRHHCNDHLSEKIAQYREMARLVLLVLARSKFNAERAAFEDLEGQLLDHIVWLFGRVNCNAFTICDDVNNPVGIGLFPQGALFNHSCEPNCIVSFRGRDMIVRAIREVGVGEELTVSYVELLESTTKRRQALKDSYFFDCKCIRCERALTCENNSEDIYLDGFACSSRNCEGAVDVNSLACCVCNKQRDHDEIKRYEQQLADINEQLRGADMAVGAKWELYQQLWRCICEKLRVHPKSSRMAIVSREIGNFVMDATELQEESGVSPLPFFLAELAATDWIIPEVKLPSRGLLHFQISKLLLQKAQLISQHALALTTIDQADSHCKSALAILDCACGTDCSIVETAAQFGQELHRFRQHDL